MKNLKKKILAGGLAVTLFFGGFICFMSGPNDPPCGMLNIQQQQTQQLHNC